MALTRVIRFILRNLDQFRGRFIATTIIGMIQGLISFGIPLLVAAFIDRVVAGEHPSLLAFCLLFSGIFVAQLGLEYYLRRKGELLGPLFSNHIRTKHFKLLLDQKTLWNQKYHSVYILTIISRIADMTRQLLNRWTWSLTTDLVFIPAFLIYIGLQNMMITVMTFIVLVIFAVLGVILTRQFAPVYEQINKNMSTFASRFADFMANIRTIKKLHVEPYVLGETRRDERTLVGDYERLKSIHANRWLILHAIFGVVLVGSLTLFINEVAQGRAQVGVIILLVPTLFRLQHLIEQAIDSVTLVVETDAYLTTLMPFVQPIPVSNDAEIVPKSWSVIAFKGIAFTHPSGDIAFTLRVSSLTIKRGEHIGIVGKSGHGKSTFFDLLVRHHTVHNGTITLDTTPYADLPKAFFAQSMSYVTQDAELFSMSIRDNILLGQKVPDKRLKDVIAGCQLASLVASLKSGTDAVVGERGVKLSTGERQRVNIARGILLNRDIYLLDEITSNIDRRTELSILQFLLKALQDKTILFITHRLENLQTMDRILLFDRGALVADGTFAALKRSNALFRDLLAHPELMVRSEPPKE